VVLCDERVPDEQRAHALLLGEQRRRELVAERVRARGEDRVQLVGADLREQPSCVLSTKCIAMPGCCSWKSAMTE
jgi:hypothetical protein